MKFKVIKYTPSPNDFHTVEDEKGDIHQFDLMVSGQVKYKTPEEFIGKTFEADEESIYPFVSIVNRFWESEGGG